MGEWGSGRHLNCLSIKLICQVLNIYYNVNCCFLCACFSFCLSVEDLDKKQKPEESLNVEDSMGDVYTYEPVGSRFKVSLFVT